MLRGVCEATWLHDHAFEYRRIPPCAMATAENCLSSTFRADACSPSCSTTGAKAVSDYAAPVDCCCMLTCLLLNSLVFSGSVLLSLKLCAVIPSNRGLLLR